MSRPGWFRFLLAGALLAAGCTATASGGQNPPAVACEATYRLSSSEGMLRTESMRLAPGDEKRIDFDDLSLTAVYTHSPYEGAALYLDSLTADASGFLSRTLYQLPQEEPLRDQFSGGHGFTGLTYIRHPDSGAEMQYWCAAAP